MITRIDYESADQGRAIVRRFAQVERQSTGWRVRTSGGARLHRHYDVPTMAQAQQTARTWVEVGERPEVPA